METYTPTPIDTSDVKLPDEIKQLNEVIAENTHEVWSENKINDGYQYGPITDDEAKTHKDLIPFCDLDEGSKNYDRNIAEGVIKTVYKLGYEIVKAD